MFWSWLYLSSLTVLCMPGCIVRDAEMVFVISLFKDWCGGVDSAAADSQLMHECWRKSAWSASSASSASSACPLQCSPVEPVEGVGKVGDSERVASRDHPGPCVSAAQPWSSDRWPVKQASGTVRWRHSSPHPVRPSGLCSRSEAPFSNAVVGCWLLIPHGRSRWLQIHRYTGSTMWPHIQWI